MRPDSFIVEYSIDGGGTKENYNRESIWRL